MQTIQGEQSAAPGKRAAWAGRFHMMTQQRPHSQEAGESPVPTTGRRRTLNPPTPIPAGLDIPLQANPDQLLDVDEVAGYLKVDRRTVEKLLRSRKLIGTKICRLWRVTLSDFRAFIDERRQT